EVHHVHDDEEARGRCGGPEHGAADSREDVDLPRRLDLPGDALGDGLWRPQARQVADEQRRRLQLAQVAEALRAGGDVTLHLRLLRGAELAVVVAGELLLVECAVHRTPMTQRLPSKFQYTASISLSAR